MQLDVGPCNSPSVLARPEKEHSVISEEAKIMIVPNSVRTHK